MPFLFVLLQKLLKNDIMNTPLIVWTCIAAVAAVLFLVRVVSCVRNHNSGGRHVKFLSMGHEWEEIYVPGDKIYHEDPRYDYDDI